MAPNTSKTKYMEGEKVLCFHGPLIYEAKCLKVQSKDKQVKYFIHYAGWNKNWDEWVPESRVLKLNDQNILRQRDLQKAHEASLKRGVHLGPEQRVSSKCHQHPITPPVAVSKCQRSSDVRGLTSVVSVLTLSPTAGRNKKSKKILEKKRSSSGLAKEGGGGASSGGGGDDSRSSTPSTDRSTGSKKSTTKESSVIDGEGKKKKAKVDNSNVEQEEQFLATVEIKIKLPDEMKPILVDDWDLINRQRKLPVLPARVSVDSILDEFIKARTNTKNCSPNKESAVQEVVAGLREYFNVMLGTQLLYKFERAQYADILKENPDKQMSSIYGLIHLTRLFVRLGQMLAYTQLDEKNINRLNFYLQDFLRFLIKNMDTFYSIQDYGIAPPEYQRKAI